MYRFSCHHFFATTSPSTDATSAGRHHGLSGPIRRPSRSTAHWPSLTPASSPRYRVTDPSDPSFPLRVPTVHIKKKVGGGGNDEDLSPEERAKREADAAARVAGIESLLRDQAKKLEATKAAADLAEKKAEMADLEGELLKQKLDAVMTEKNSVERMLEEMAKKKDAAEMATAREASEKAKYVDENNELLNKVTVLNDARVADKHQYAVQVCKYRDELVAYTEKTPTEFLAEILALVSDMDNEVDIELVDAEVAAARLGNRTRVAKEEELKICSEWTHNPALAMANPHKLMRLASRTRALAAPPNTSSATASTSNGGGKVVNASGISVSTTPEMAARRRTALGALDQNAATAAAAAYSGSAMNKLQDQLDAIEMRLDKAAGKAASMGASLLDTHYVDITPSASPLTSPKMLSAKKMARSENDDGLVFQGGVASKSMGGRSSGLASRGAGFQAKASVNIGGIFGSKAAPAMTPTKQLKGMDVFDDFEPAPMGPRPSRAMAVLGK